MNKVTVGLFGSAGQQSDPTFVDWRTPICEGLAKMNCTAFDPVVDDWNAEAAVAESFHFRTCDILAFYVHTKTEGFGAAAEIGFGVAEAVASNRPCVFYLELFDDESAKAIFGHKKTLNRPRLLAIQRARDLIATHPDLSSQIYVCDTYEEFIANILYLAEQNGS